MQDEIPRAISGALKVRLAPRTQTVNIEAWQHYLKGRYHYLRYTPDGLAKAKKSFEQARAVDPNFVLAYTGLASYYYSLAALGMRPAGEVAPLSKSAAEKALAIEPANSEAHSVRAVLARNVRVRLDGCGSASPPGHGSRAPFRPWCDSATACITCSLWGESLRQSSKPGWRSRAIRCPCLLTP